MPLFKSFGLGFALVLIAGPARGNPPLSVTVKQGKCELQRRGDNRQFNPLLGPWIPGVRLDLSWENPPRRRGIHYPDYYTFQIVAIDNSGAETRDFSSLLPPATIAAKVLEKKAVLWAPCEGLHEMRVYEGFGTSGHINGFEPAGNILQTLQINLTDVQAPGTPSAPMEVNVISRGRSNPINGDRRNSLNATISWSPPVSRGNSDIIDYRIQFRAIANPPNYRPRKFESDNLGRFYPEGRWVNIPSARSTDLVLRDIPPKSARWEWAPNCGANDHYQFRVAAVNRQGVGAFSEPFELRGGSFCDFLGESAPQTPSPGEPASFESCSFTFTWNPRFFPDQGPKRRRRTFHLPEGAKDIEFVDIAMEHFYAFPKAYLNRVNPQSGNFPKTGPQYPQYPHRGCAPRVSRWLGNPNQKVKYFSREDLGWEKYEDYLKTFKVNSGKSPNHLVPVTADVFIGFNKGRRQCFFDIQHGMVFSGTFKGLRSCQYLNPDQVRKKLGGNFETVSIFNSKGDKVFSY